MACGGTASWMDAGVKSKRPQMAPGSLKRLQEVCKFTTETLKFEMIEMFNIVFRIRPHPSHRRMLCGRTPAMCRRPRRSRRFGNEPGRSRLLVGSTPGHGPAVAVLAAVPARRRMLVVLAQRRMMGAIPAADDGAGPAAAAHDGAAPSNHPGAGQRAQPFNLPPPPAR